MSSSNKKTFKTSESSKQAGTTVTSDAILLDPTTTDHILVVTADSSANLTGQVDVELEMSPDGQNWCPAQIKSTTTTSGGTTTTDPIVGNEKAVDLTADPASTSEYKNKFARGRLEYYISTNQEYTGSTVDERQRADAADFMHHMIGTTKNFNYSGWYKSDVQPSTTYTPVLFRNGGIDPFENTQVVDLTDSVTQNLCNADTSNSTYLQFNPMTAGNFIFSSFYSTSTSVTSPFYNSSTNPTNAFPKAYTTETLRQDGDDDVSGGFSVGFWLKVDSPINTSNGYTSIINTFAGTSNNILQLGICSYNGLFRFYWRMSSSAGGTLAYGFLSGNNIASLPGSGWNYLVVRIDTTINNVAYAAAISINGSSFSASTAAAANTSGGMTVLNNWGTNSDAITNVKFNMNYAGNTQTIGADFAIDSLVFIDGLVGDSVVGSLYANANNPYNAALDYTLQGLSSTGSGFTVNKYYTPSVRSFMKCGDGPNDNISTAQAEVIEADNGLQMTAGNVTTKHTFATYVAGELPGAAVANSFPSVFNSTSSFSVSGWFKTELGATGTLFSNGPLASLAGLSLDIASSTYIDLKLGTYSTAKNCAPVILNDGNWHHILLTRTPTGTYGIYVDGKSEGITGYPNVDPKGSYGFTLLGDGQNNVTATNPSSTDPSKLNASLSNWSIHSETLSSNAAVQLYSNGHVRNIKNLPSINSGNIVAWWQLNDGANPEQDLSGNGYDLTYQDGHTITETLVQQLVPATGATLVQNTLNGHGITLSLTKNFDYATGWVSDASGEASICLSFNGFERYAEYTALWKCNQVSKGINLLDGNWHNIVLSYRGRNDSQSSDETTSSYVQEGDIVRFGPDTTAQNFNFNLSIDGVELNDINNGIGADVIYGIDPSVLINNGTNYTGFRIYNRHLKFTDHPEESYMAHTQGGATNIIISPGGIRQPATDLDNPWSFQGIIDETSFHSQNFWESSGGIDPNNFESEYPATIYGNTNALSGTRGAGSTYDVGTPYPLNNPASIGATQGSSQYINPDRYDPSTNPGGGLEAWWRWGDTSGDCAENVNDVKDSADSTPSALITNHHLRAVEFGTNHLYTLVDGVDSTYVQNVAGGTTTTPGSSVTTFVSVVMENIVDTACNVKDLALPILQYLRVKFTGSGSIDLGQGKAEASLWWKKRRTK